MVFQFFSDKPNAFNPAGDDQQDMLTNTQSMDQIIAIDHIGFETLGGGYHKQVTLSKELNPIFPALPPYLGSSINSDISTLQQLFWYSGQQSQSRQQYNTKTTTDKKDEEQKYFSLSTFCFGGIILKIGRVIMPIVNIYNIETIEFNEVCGSPFVNNCYSVVLTPVYGSRFPTIGSQSFPYSVLNLTKDSFDLHTSSNPSLGLFFPNNVVFYFLAIGN